MKNKVRGFLTGFIVSFLVLFGIFLYLRPDITSGNNLEAGLEIEPALDKMENPARVENVSILAAGDAMFHMPQIRAAYREGTYDFTNNFRYVANYAKNSDLALVNFETVAGGRELGYSGYPKFNAPVESLSAIKNAGFDIVSTANNHILDRGRSGLINTVNNVELAGLKNIGTSLPGQEKYLLEDVRGVRIGFLSYAYGCNGLENTLSQEDRKSILNIIDEEKIKVDIEDLKTRADFIVVYIHWGEEYSLSPNSSQEDLANKIFTWGGDIIFGSHPHVIQRSEKKSVAGVDKFVVYSLGNFISNQRYETLKNYNTEDGLMVRLNLSKNFETGERSIEEIEYIPTWVYKYSLNGRNNYEILPIDDILIKRYEVFNLKAIEGRLRSSNNRTMNRLENK